MSVVSVINQKGGVAKTTTTINVAFNWAESGKKVLLVDLDPQASATKAIFAEETFDLTVYDLLVNQIEAKEVIKSSETFGIDVIPSEIMLSGADIQLAGKFAREQILRKALFQVQHEYDAIIIDCSPSLGLLTINALMASDDIIVPICPEYFSMRGIELIFDTLESVRSGLGHEVKVRGIVITRYRRRKIANDVIKQVEQKYGMNVYEDFIPDNIAVEEAHHKHLPVTKYSPRCKASIALKNLSREMWQ